MVINRDPQLVNMQKIQDFGVLSPKRDVCTNTLPSKFRDCGGRGDGKMLRVDYLKEAVCFQNTTDKACLSSSQAKSHDGVRKGRRGESTKSPCSSVIVFS